jgi:hypothetical protein
MEGMHHWREVLKGFCLAKSHCLLRTAWVCSLLGMVAMIWVAWSMFTMGTLPELLDEAESIMVGELTRITRTHHSEGAAQLRSSMRESRRLVKRLERSRRWYSDSLMPDELKRLEHTMAETGRVISDMENWEKSMRENRGLPQDRYWESEVVVAVLRERMLWPLKGIVRIPRLHEERNYGIEVYRGLSMGAGWPFIALRNSFMRDGGLRYGLFRRVFFPHGAMASIRVTHILGLSIGAFTMGYGLCWLGMRWNRAWPAYLGLLYFAYVLFFSVGLAFLYAGVLS